MAVKKTPATGGEGEQPGFEDALERLETIVDELESGTLSLDESIARYEEGVKLSRTLTRQLDAAEKRIERLVEGGDSPTTEPADLDEAAAEPPAAARAARPAAPKRTPPDDDPAGRLPF